LSDTINFSDTYIKVLTLLGKASFRADKKNSILFFKDDDLTRITIMGKQSLLHIMAPECHIKINSDELGIIDIQQFTRYCKAIAYPKIDSLISHALERSTLGRTYETLTFTNKNLTFKSAVASLTLFDSKYDRKIPTPSDEDPLRLAAKLILTPENLKTIGTARSLMGSDAESFCLSVDNNVLSIYIAGSLPGHQVKIEFDNLSYVVFGDFETKVSNSSKHKLFSLQFLEAMQLFPIDFTCEVRVYEVGQMQTIVLKSYGEITEGAGEPIKIIVACQEAEAAVISNNFDIIM